MEGANVMPCNGCKEQKEKAHAERQTLDGKVMAALSEAVGEVRSSNPALAAKLMALNGEINAQGAKERAASSVK